MAVELQLEELQLPSELLDDLFFVDGERNTADKMGGENDGDRLAGLAWKMSRSLLHDDGGVVKMRAAWDPFDEAAGRAAGQRRWSLHEGGFRGEPRKLCPGKSADPFLSHQHLQAARIVHLKQQQVVQQQLYAAWERQSRARRAASYEASRCSRSVVLPSSGWSPRQMQQQQPHDGSEMRAVFLRNCGARKESVGTGVFLPRTAASKDDSPQKSACSTVLIPARVVQALNWNLEKLGAQATASFPDRFLLQHDGFMRRRNFLKSHSRPQPAAIRAPINSLPQEWTY